MANILQFLQQKKNQAAQALQGVGNFIDQDKTMGGVQLMQGGLGNKIGQVAQQAPGFIQRKITETPNALLKMATFDNSLPAGQRGLTEMSPLWQLPYGKEIGTPEWNEGFKNASMNAIMALSAGPKSTTPNINTMGSHVLGSKNVTSPLDEILRGTNAVQLPKRATSTVVNTTRGGTTTTKTPSIPLYTTPEGTTFKVNRQPKTTQSLDMVLNDVDEAINPVDKTVIETKSLPAPKEFPLLNELNGRPEMPKFSEALKAPEVVTPPIKEPLLPQTYKSKLKQTTEGLSRSKLVVIEKSGSSGKAAATLIKKTEEQGARLAGDWNDGLRKTIEPLSKVEKETLSDVIEGKLAPISQAQQNAANTWRYIANQLNKSGKEAGLDLGTLPNYFPHKTLPLTQELKNKIGQELVSKGKFANVTDAIASLEQEAKNFSLSRTSPRRYANLELARETNLPYSKDPSVLYDYIDNATRRVTDAQKFGPNDEILYDLAKKAGTQGGDTGQLNSYLDQILGKNQNAGAEKISRTIRAVGSSKLSPMSPIQNLTQNISHLMRTNPKAEATTIKRLIDSPDMAKSIAIRSGELGMEVDQAMQELAGISNKYVKGIGMNLSERANRVLATNAGYSFAEDLSKQVGKGSKTALRELERLGFTADEIAQGLKESDFITAGRRVSQETQFSPGTTNLPYLWSTPAGKVVTQFKPFAFQQTGFVFKKLLPRVTDEALKGNFGPLGSMIIGYGIATPVAGEILNDIKSVFRNKKREDTGSLQDRYISNALAGFSLGLLDLNTIKGATGGYGPKGVASAFLGPVVGGMGGDLIEGIAGTSAAIGGDKYQGRVAARDALKQIPAVGQTLANTLVPNSYVQNYIGQNQGMTEPDTKTYNNLKQSDPQQAELFKEGKINERTSEPNLLQKLMSGDKPKPLSPNATPEEKKQYDTETQDMLNAGGLPDQTRLKQYVTKGKDPKSKSIEERTKAYTSVKYQMDNELYSDEQKQAILEASGIPKESYDYFNSAGKDKDVKLQELLPKLDNMDTDQVVKTLMQGRMVIAGKQLVTPEMLTYLYENDYIDENAKEAINALKFDEVNSKFYFTKAFSKKGKGTMTYKQAKALYDNLPKFSILKDTGDLMKTLGSQTSGSGDKLIESILSRKTPIKNTNSKLWF